MADDTRSYGYRANTPYDRTQRAAPAARTQGDPLAELARLIGQQNESAPSYRQNGAPAANYDSGSSNDGWSQSSQDPYAQYEGYSSSGHPNPSSQSGYDDSQYADPRYADPRYDSSHGYADPNLAPGSYPQAYSDSRYSDPQYNDPRYADPRYAGTRYDASQGYSGQGYSDPQVYSDQQGYSDPRYAAPSHDAQGYGAQPSAYPQDASAYGNMPSFARPDGQQGYSDPYYGNASPASMHMPVADDHRPARRRGSIVTVLAVLALAVVGTAAAFGYRAMFGTAGTPVPPPVIKADPRPSKVVPVAGDPNAKPIQDRVGGDAERVVSREEAPVDPSRASNPRVIFPNLAEQGQKPGGPAVAANVGSTGSAAGPAEPKKIRTVAIKPEQGGAQASAARNAQASADNAPLPLSPGAQQAPAAPASSHRQAPPPAQQQPQLASRGAPGGSASPFPAPIGNAPSAAVPSVAAGAYAVQVTSQRSEADAQSSYKSLQAQFPSVLGGRQPVIKKADLGDKGTYYRAQIPFASQNEASEFCSSLKSAGGQCVVQKN
jgi:hypothetical protein